MAIYLDHAATTPLRREVLDAMLPYLTESFGNPSSAHAFGRAARAGLDEAHERVAARLHAEPREIVFTSGGTEANNLALKGAAWAGKARGHRIVTSSVEHHAVGHTLRYLEKFGFEIVELPVDRYGRVDPDQLEAAMTDRTILVSIMLANNEVGTIQPITEIARQVGAHKGVLFHVDAVQAAPYVDLDVAELGADLISLGAHKLRDPRASARCTSATERTSSPSSTAADRSGIDAPARRTSRAPSGWPRPTSCRAPNARPRWRGSWMDASDWQPPYCRCPASSSPATRPSGSPDSSRSSPATPTGRQCRCRSISRGSRCRSDRRAPQARPRCPMSDSDGLSRGRGTGRAAPVAGTDHD